MVLYRRSCSHITERRRRNARTLSLPLYENSVTLTSSQLPTEILDEIVQFALVIASTDLDYPGFAFIRSLTLASSCFRKIVFRRYLSSLTLNTLSQLDNTFKLLLSLGDEPFAGAFSWVRTVHAPSGILSAQPHASQLCYLTNLNELSINCNHEGFSTYQQRFKLICVNLTSCSPIMTLTTLTLTALPRIETRMLQRIALSFPSIVNLYLSCTERLNFSHCWCCLEDSLTCTMHSPVPERYLEVHDLATAFADALKPLKNLTDLHLGVFLSHEDLVYSHMRHAPHYLGHPDIISAPSECDICADHAKDVRMDELAASLIVARKIRGLQTIGWSSFFGYGGGDWASNGEKADDDVNDGGGGDQVEDTNSDIIVGNDCKTKVWILRMNGRVRVRRVPW
ncbi:uncharacterized protein BT62DRAFT_971188 [Guyanagaster necrorhizus]|uniref:F-box domain-containing protein n=1 Tax=Guyanagaster necrorhizus TaxID=856835 RepID=A0A9P7VPT6_9AGAR|nr:uncharacterized protein BT62DRAFT_971188 [Guyanagaster necrorhizus MCA 3950]KAG7444473.1 hypothetical protein BT62DRAFT_971188 [Guyanagaster necrorhizus MCA 3950]